MTEQELIHVGKERHLFLLDLIREYMFKYGLKYDGLLMLPEGDVGEMPEQDLNSSIFYLNRDRVLDKKVVPRWVKDYYEGIPGRGMSFSIRCQMDLADLDLYIANLRAPNRGDSGEVHNKPDTVKRASIDIVLDPDSGIYCKDNRAHKYSIGGARRDYVFAIYKNRGQTMRQLKELHNQADSIVSAGIASINKNVKKKLLGGDGPNLIEHNATAGKYVINKESFSFVSPRHVE